jgi:hypothetical protein
VVREASWCTVAARKQVVGAFSGSVRLATGGRAGNTGMMAALPGPGPSDAQAPAAARPPADDPVTVLYSRRVKPGREADFEAWAHGIVAAAR